MTLKQIPWARFLGPEPPLAPDVTFIVGTKLQHLWFEYGNLDSYFYFLVSELVIV